MEENRLFMDAYMFFYYFNIKICLYSYKIFRK